MNRKEPNKTTMIISILKGFHKKSQRSKVKNGYLAVHVTIEMFILFLHTVLNSLTTG